MAGGCGIFVKTEKTVIDGAVSIRSDNECGEDMGVFHLNLRPAKEAGNEISTIHIHLCMSAGMYARRLERAGDTNGSPPSL